MSKYLVVKENIFLVENHFKNANLKHIYKNAPEFRFRTIEQNRTGDDQLVSCPYFANCCKLDMNVKVEDHNACLCVFASYQLHHQQIKIEA